MSEPKPDPIAAWNAKVEAVKQKYKSDIAGESLAEWTRRMGTLPKAKRPPS